MIKHVILNLPFDKCGGNGVGFLTVVFSPLVGNTLMADIPAIVFAGKLGPEGLSNDEQRYKNNFVVFKKFMFYLKIQ